MKRDMDLVRKILFTIEAEPSGFAPRLSIDGYGDEQVGFHVVLMDEAGLVKAVDVTGDGDTSPMAIPSRITWRGYEFLDAAREPARWEQAKGVMAKVGGASFQVLVSVLTQLATQAVTQLIEA